MATPQRLPIVNSDDGTWGDIIRQYLLKEHYDDGTDNTVNGGHQKITIRAGTATAGTAPLKFTSGTLLTTPEAGATEFNANNLYFTVTTGTVRKKIAMYDDSAGATGDLYYRDSSGNFVRLGVGATGQALKTAGTGLPAWGNAMSFNFLSVSGNYTISNTDTFVIVTGTSADVTITLPTAASLPGYRFYVKLVTNTGDFASIARSSTDLIDGQTSFLLKTRWATIGLISDGSSNWYII